MQKETLSLTLSVDEGRLFVLLTDTRRFSKHGWARTDLQSIRQVAAAVEPAVLQELIFPVSINQAIENSNATVLHVQIERSLAFLPLEGFRTSSQRWCERFAMACYLSNLELTNTADYSAKNALHDQIKISMTTRLLNRDQSSDLTNHLMRKGLFIANHATHRHASTVLLACSAQDAVEHMRRIADHLPQLCVWPADSMSNTAGEEIAGFLTEFPACSALTGLNFATVEELIVGMTPALTALNTGMAPRFAVQSALQIDDNSYRRLRLYNCDDTALCNPHSIAQLETENRTITALSLDVVASTKMMHRLGNERYSEVLATLKEHCIKCIYERGGSSGGRAGDDSTMAYFGLPNSLENTAKCAMETALAVHAILPTLPGHPELRIGIATGRVAVRSGVPYGEPIHLAARLQGYGEAGDVIVDTASQWLARQDYEFEPCGDYTVFHGIDHPVLPVKLIAHAGEISTVTNLTTAAPFIGRTDEMKKLADCWQQTWQGEQQVVCIRGEAGIGKSRLMREFMKSVIPDGVSLLKIRGFSDYQSEVFYSLTESLKRSFGIKPDDTLLQIKQRINAVTSYPPVTVQNIAYVAEMLGITEPVILPESGEPFVKRNSDPGLRERLFDLLTEAVEVAARDKPLILLVDDLQWVGPSVREALEHIITELRSRKGVRILVLCTERDDQEYDSLPNASTLILKRLSKQVAYQFIRSVVGDSTTDESVRRLVNRSEGVPLFLEESARLALDQPGDINDTDQNVKVPDSIDNLLMSRLDHLDKSGKYVVQIASVIGNEVQVDFLRSVVARLTDEGDANNFQTQLDSFRDLGVLCDMKGKGPASLTFRHEMIRDVAYTSMWQRDRITVHAAIAQEIMAEQHEGILGQPGIIAHHLTLSEQHEPAVSQWEKAAQLSAYASANQETIQNLRRALLSLQHLINNEHTARQEMRLQLMLAARLIASEGYGAEEVRSAYERADVLVRQFGTQRDQLKVMLGLESVHVMRGELTKAEALAEAAVDIATKLPDSQYRTPMSIQANWALANVSFHQGYTNKALTLMNQCLDDCRCTQHKPSAVQDPEIMCLCYGAWALWERGCADTAITRAAKAVSLAKSRQHRFSEAEAFGFYASVAMFRGETDAAIAHAEEAIAICEKEKFAIWLAHARIILGRSMAMAKKQEDVIGQMEQGYQDWVKTGAAITRAFYLSLIAETHLENGNMVSAIDKINEASDIIARTGDRYHLAEILRIQGLIAYNKQDDHRGDSLMRQAIDVAQRQEKQSFVLRSSIALARSLVSRERKTEAVSIVSSALSKMPEGMTTNNPIQAQLLLSEWTDSLTPVARPTQSQNKITDQNTGGHVIEFPKSVND